MAANLPLQLEQLAMRLRALESAEDVDVDDLADALADLEQRVEALERRPAQALIVGGAGGGVGAPGEKGERGERGPVAQGYWPGGW